MHALSPRKRDALLRELPSWDDVRFFLAIHRAGSLSAAAGALGVTQPTCGRRLATLEASIGVHLFHRTSSGLRITHEGAALLGAATMMEQSAHELALLATAKDRSLEGTVCIATNDLFACSFLIGALPLLRAKHPGIRVELSLSSADADLLDREADIALRFRPKGTRLTSDALVATRLGDEPFLLYGTDHYLRRRGAPSDPNRLDGHEVVLYSGRHPASAWCAQAFRGSTVVLAASSMQVAGAGIAAGLGLGVLPRRAARLFPLLHPLSPAIAHATGWLVMHPDLRRVPRIHVVANLLTALFRNSSRDRA